MTINERHVGHVVVLDLVGNFTERENAELLGAHVNRLLIQHHPLHIVLNMEAVPYVDSIGLGEIIRAYTAASRSGGSLKLLKLTRRLQDLLSITKLLTVFESFENEQVAIASFNPVTASRPW